MNLNRVLLISAHPDDAEVGAGGTVTRIKREHPKCEFWSLYFSPCTEDKRNVGHLEDHRKVVKLLGIDKLVENNLARDGYLEAHKQEARDILFKVREEFQPELVLCPSLHDYHQDHKAVAECVPTIFRDTSTILAYEITRSVTPEFNPMAYVILEEKDVLQKLGAIRAYKSQIAARPYFFDDSIFMAQAVTRGCEARAKWAEAFEVMRARL